MATQPCALIAACDRLLAGIYGRTFEREGWQVEVVADVKEAEHRAVLLRPNVLLLESDCAANVAAEVRRLKTLPTLLHAQIIILAQQAQHSDIQAALTAGANDVVLVGHLTPAEAVAKVKRFVGV